MNARAKGIRGELGWRDVVRAHGYEAQRGQQHAGSPGSPDVVHDVPGVHFEVKNQQRPEWRAWFAQATRDAGDRFPAVAWHTTRNPWLVVMEPAAYFRLVECAAMAQHFPRTDEPEKE